MDRADVADREQTDLLRRRRRVAAMPRLEYVRRLQVSDRAYMVEPPGTLAHAFPRRTQAERWLRSMTGFWTRPLEIVRAEDAITASATRLFYHQREPHRFYSLKERAWVQCRCLPEEVPA